MDELEKENIMIEDMIYEIRGKQVMLDSDLAKLYQCKINVLGDVLQKSKYCNQLGGYTKYILD